MKFILPGPETITIAGQTVEKLLSAGDGDAALLYLYVLKTRGQGTPDEAESALGRSAGEIASAMAMLNRLGLVRYEGNDGGQRPGEQPEPEAGPSPVFDEPRGYSIDEVRNELENGSEFALLVGEAQRSLGKILSPDELVRLFGIYDNLRLPTDVILQLITHCIEESRGKQGGGRMPTVRYIEKAAYTWEREGIFSLDRAEKYLKELDRRRGAYGEVKKALQIKDRELSASERRYVDGWLAMGFHSDAVEIAYDRTVMKTGRLAWGYMDSIMKSWHGKGLHKPDEILTRDGKTAVQKYGPRDNADKHPIPAPDDIERMKRLIERMKEE